MASESTPLVGSEHVGRATAAYYTLKNNKTFAIIACLVLSGITIELGLVFGLKNRSGSSPVAPQKPVVIATWFPAAVQIAYNLTLSGFSATDSVEAGCAYCEEAQCDGSVGWGNHPDTNGETTLDAVIMDGVNLNTGAVAFLRNVKHAISAAKSVLHYSRHTVLAGDGATNFSVMMGQELQDLHSPSSIAVYNEWRAQNCQPNFYANVQNGNTTCPPYVPIPTPTPGPVYPAVVQQLSRAGVGNGKLEKQAASPTPKPASAYVTRDNHDTVGMCVLDAGGNIAGGGSSNGANHKIAGRVGDVPIIGAAIYADNTAGCAAGTGDGDITMRFLPAYQAVEFMRQGMPPQQACEAAVRRIMRIYGTSFQIGLVCLSPTGETGAAAQGWTFTYATQSVQTGGQAVAINVEPLSAN